MSSRISASIALAFVLSFTNAAAAAELANYARTEDGRIKLVVLPPEFRVFQLGASAVTTHEMPEWSQQAEANGARALAEFGKHTTRFAPLALPEVDDAERAAIEEHLALADVVGYTAYLNRQFGGKPWAHKQKDFDYTLGPGLEFLRERTGADLAAFVVGTDMISTGGRVGMGVLLFVASGGNAVMQGGQTFMLMGLIDLKTGALVWVNYDQAGSDFRQPENVYAYIDRLVCAYPDGRIFGKKPPSCGRDWVVLADGSVEPKTKGKSKSKGDKAIGASR